MCTSTLKWALTITYTHTHTCSHSHTHTYTHTNCHTQTRSFAVLWFLDFVGDPMRKDLTCFVDGSYFFWHWITAVCGSGVSIRWSKTRSVTWGHFSLLGAKQLLLFLWVSALSAEMNWVNKSVLFFILNACSIVLISDKFFSLISDKLFVCKSVCSLLLKIQGFLNIWDFSPQVTLSSCWFKCAFHGIAVAQCEHFSAILCDLYSLSLLYLLCYFFFPKESLVQKCLCVCQVKWLSWIAASYGSLKYFLLCTCSNQPVFCFNQSSIVLFDLPFKPV